VQNDTNNIVYHIKSLCQFKIYLYITYRPNGFLITPRPFMGGSLCVIIMFYLINITYRYLIVHLLGDIVAKCCCYALFSVNNLLTCVSHTVHVVDIGCPSVCPSHASTVSKRLNLLSNCLHCLVAP